MFKFNCCGEITDEPHIDSVLPQLLTDIENAEENDTTALRCVYQLCNEENQQNRVAIICSSKWDALTILIKCLSYKEGNGKQLACLTLANLAIPFENKVLMSLGSSAEVLFTELFTIMKSNIPETYLACICLVNLSFVKDAVRPIFFFALNPPNINYSKKSIPLLDNPNSACRILEGIIRACIYPPIAATVQSEAVRWACALVKHVTVVEDVCNMLVKTQIPRHIVGYLKFTKQPLSKWTDSSVEDLSLRILLNFSKWPQTLEVMKKLDTLRVIGFIIGQGGVHDYRASLIRACLE